MKISMAHFKYLVKVTHHNGSSDTCPFVTERAAMRFIENIESACPDCKAEIITK